MRHDSVLLAFADARSFDEQEQQVIFSIAIVHGTFLHGSVPDAPTPVHYSNV